MFGSRLGRIRGRPAAGVRRADDPPAGRQRPLSSAQEQLWFLDQLVPNSAYNISDVWALDGKLDREALEAACRSVLQRHEILRTTFHNTAGKPVQIVSSDVTFELDCTDLSSHDLTVDSKSLRDRVYVLSHRRFDLSRDPMVRAALLRLGETQHVLVITLHHIAADGSSMPILFRELTEFYNAFVEGRPAALDVLPFQYADFAERQREWLRGPAYRKQVDYWKQALNGCPPLFEIPPDHARPERLDFEGGFEDTILPETLVLKLKDLGARHRATLFMVLLGAFQLVLSRFTNRTDILTGTAFANRPDTASDQLIGFFINTLVLRADLSGEPTFTELLPRVRDAALGAFSHHDLPFERLVAELQPQRGPGHNPLFEVMITSTGVAERTLAPVGLTAKNLDIGYRPAHFGITFGINSRAEGTVQLRVTYQRALYAQQRIRALADQTQSLLEQIAAEPHQPISRYNVAVPAATPETAHLQLPGRKQAPANAPGRIAAEHLRLTPRVQADLEAFCRREQLPRGTALLAAFEVLLHRYTGREEFVINVKDEDSDGPSLASISSETSFRDVVAGVRSSRPVTADNPPRVAFRSHTPDTPVENNGAELTLAVSGPPGPIGLSLHYDAARLESWAVRAMLGHLQILLERALGEHPAPKPASSLPVLTEPEHRRLTGEWNATAAAYPHRHTLPELFETQVDQAPDAVAVVFEDQRLSFRQLDHAANQLAHYLRRLGVGPETLVGLCLERTPEMVIAILGILKAGGAYVPLDSRSPAKRLAGMIDDAGLSVVVSTEPLLHHLPPAIEHLVCLDRDRAVIEACPPAPARSGAGPRNPAYAIFTSGSTGQPKAVVIEHRSVVNYVSGVTDQLGLRDLAGFAMVQPLSVDSSVTSIYPPLLYGGCLHLISEDRALDASSLADYVRRHEIDCLKIAPSHLAALHAAGGAVMPRKVLILGGEVSRWGAIQRYQALAPDCQIYNHYGPTEATVGATIFPAVGSAAAAPEVALPIGRPLPNTTAYILDAHRQPVPAGVTGELYLGGNCLARGYLNQPETTAAQFVSDPFSDQPAARLYRTGDLARYQPDGNIEFLGRKDNQVKVRGFRIEPGEVESVIARHPKVRDVAVTADSSRNGETELVAHVTTRDNGELSDAAMRLFLADHLPPHLIPTRIAFYDSLPRTPHGKLDRSALAASAPTAAETTLPPRDALETRLVNIWEETLGVSPVGVRDNFFASGGHSLLAVALLARIHREFGQKLPLSVFFSAPTIESQAQVLRDKGWSPPWSSLVEIQPRGSKPPLFCVHAAQGNVLFYADLARHLGEDQPLYGLQSAGVDGSREPYLRVDAMAAAYIDELKDVQPHGPYYLGGFCSGAYVALEMAHQLEQRGDKVALLISFSTDGAWKTVQGVAGGIGHHWHNLSRLEARRKLDYLAAHTGFRTARIIGGLTRLAGRLCFSLGKPLLAFLLPRYVEEANRLATRLYEPRRYHGPLLYIQGAGEAFRDPHPFWANLVGSLEVQRVAGAGMSIFREPDVKELANCLGKCLETSDTTTTNPVNC